MRNAGLSTGKWIAAVAILFLARGGSGQQATPLESGPASPKTLERVVVMGASLSAGFGLRRTLADALEASLAAPPHEPVRSFASELFFTHPLGFGPTQVDSVVELEPTLVVALDFLFWFGYGSANAQGAPIASEDERLALLEHGLELLEEIECPLVLGDFPDMSKAIGKMLAEVQVPEPETLARLSERVRAWAAEDGRERVIVVPLSELVRSLGSQAALRVGRHEWPAGTRLLQRDDLHPTLEGLASVAQLVLDELVRAELASEADVRFALADVLAKLK